MLLHNPAQAAHPSFIDGGSNVKFRKSGVFCEPAGAADVFGYNVNKFTPNGLEKLLDDSSELIYPCLCRQEFGDLTYPYIPTGDNFDPRSIKTAGAILSGNGVTGVGFNDLAG